MKVKGIYAILAIAAIVGAGVCLYFSDYSIHWRILEILAGVGAGIFLGAIVWIKEEQGSSSKLPD